MITKRRVIFILYLLFIIYGSLFPLNGWRLPQQDHWSIWMKELSAKVSYSDVLTNLLVYIPFGFLLALNLPEKLNNVARVVVVTLAGSVLSATLEYTQIFLPGRTSSLNDVLFNALSSCCGGLFFWSQEQQSRLGKKLRLQRNRWFKEGQISHIGLAIIGSWALMQLAPFVPSLDIGNIKNGLKPIWYAVHNMSSFNIFRCATYALYIAALAAALYLVLKFSRQLILWHCLFIGTVLFCKIFIISRQLSLEALAGMFFGTCVLVILQKQQKSCIPLFAMALVMAGFVIDELRPVHSFMTDFHEFSWIPFNSQIGDNLKGVGSIIEVMWPFAAISYFYIASGVTKRKIATIYWGGALTALGVFLLEYAQKLIPGRYPDISVVLLAVAGWSLPWLLLADGNAGKMRIEKIT